MEKDIEAEIKSHLNFIIGMGIKAWIPGSTESSPKMSVKYQCRCGVLCLKHKGSDIYIQGNSRKQLNRFDGGFGNTELNDNLGVKITLHDASKKCVRDIGIQWSDKDIIDDSFEIPKFLKSPTNHLEKVVETRINGIDQKTFAPENTGVMFYRTVDEKLTREVRVAKCYVSSLPNPVLNFGSCDTTIAGNCHLDKKALRSDYTGKLWSSLECKSLDEIKKSGLSPGFVRQLIKQFDVYDNVEQQRPIRKTL